MVVDCRRCSAFTHCSPEQAREGLGWASREDHGEMQWLCPACQRRPGTERTCPEPVRQSGLQRMPMTPRAEIACKLAAHATEAATRLDGPGPRASAHRAPDAEAYRQLLALAHAESQPPERSTPRSLPTLEQARRTVPHLVVHRQIGRGGMAVVFEGWDPHREQAVAIKLMAPLGERELELRLRLFREARALATLDHPAIVKLLESGEHEGQPFFVMEFVRGTGLRDLLQHGALPQARAIHIAIQIARGLEHAHERGILHRDIKPENVLVDQSGTVKLLDFGIARFMSPEPGDVTLTATHDRIGTLLYMAPERIAGDRGVDARTDIYALGMLVAEMLSGARPQQPGVLPPSLPALPDSLDSLLHAMVAPDPGHRPCAQSVVTRLQTMT